MPARDVLRRKAPSTRLEQEMSTAITFRKDRVPPSWEAFMHELRRHVRGVHRGGPLIGSTITEFEGQTQSYDVATGDPSAPNLIRMRPGDTLVMNDPQDPATWFVKGCDGTVNAAGRQQRQ